MFAGPSCTTCGSGRGRPQRSRKSGRLTPAAIRPLSPEVADLLGILREYCRRYANPKTAYDYRSTLERLFRQTGRQHPAELTEADLLAFCTTGNPANNTVYQRSTKVVTFLRWCERTGVIDANPAAHLRDPDSPLRTYRRTYGKVQARNPGRWLTHEEAYGRLIGACEDSSLIGLRDEVVIRLGLMGMRLSEIGELTIDNLRHLPTVHWTGKGRKPRQATAGTALVEAIGRYLDAYPDPQPADPLICRQVLGASRQGGRRRIDWHHRASNRTLFYIVNDRARVAGLGHVAPHDLRRTG